MEKGRNKTKRSGGNSGSSSSKRGKSGVMGSSNGAETSLHHSSRPINSVSEPPKNSPPGSPASESQNSLSALNSLASATTAALNQSSGGIPSGQLTIGFSKKGKKKKEEKDVKLFQNGVSAPHMLGNQLNPSSTMAQRMSDTLSAELEAHSIFTDSNSTAPQLIGPQLHSRVIASVRGGSGGGNPTSGTPPQGGSGGTNTPQSLDQLLERQWEQGSQFLMEQAQHFDIASLLTCLHQLRAENLRLEEHVSSLLQRRDHLLAVNARLAIPLPPIHPNHHQQGTPPSSAQGQMPQQQQGHQHHHQGHLHHHHHMHPNNVNPQVNNHLNSGGPGGPVERGIRMLTGGGGHQQSQPMENGLPPVGVDPSSHHVSSGVPHDPSPVPPQHHQGHSHRGQGVVVVGGQQPTGQLMAPSSGHRF
ncbi:hypothetical protein J437_LFUL015228 [Ladona fulva]|uniref:Alhambra n=1 Tax=Ladona fulva TaxID=123851 RepID=A0A8K0P8D0_LADFU|nr:hypothetical protein J437_LFUL015228 [Ladona fulva]